MMLCPVCQSEPSAQHPAGSMSRLPVVAHALSLCAEAAREVPLRDLELSFCRDCGHLFNRIFDASAVVYDTTYDNSLEHSPLFVQYLEDLAHRLVVEHDLEGKTVLEIGCGQGSFLRALCRLGKAVGLGYDPSIPVRHSELLSGGGKIYLEPGLFSADAVADPVDFVGCRHVLEHLEQPRDLIRRVRSVLKPGGSVYFEVPNARWLVRDRSVWDLLYEHCGYFSKESLGSLFELEGFVIKSLAEGYGGQFLQLEAVVPKNPPLLSSPKPLNEELSRAVGDFGIAVGEERDRWTERLETLRLAGERVAIWGAGSKTVTFLNAVDSPDVVELVVDINPRKAGRFVAGSGHLIVAPEALPSYGINHLLLMNPNYREEVQVMCAQIGVQADLEVVV